MTELLEIWKDIPGYEGIYQASNLGKIKRLARISNGRSIREKILSAGKTGDGYLQVGIFGKRHTVHSLVLLTFMGPRPADKPQIRHLDNDPSNNNVENVVYGTASENALDAHSHRRSKKQPFRFSKERAVKIKEKLSEKAYWTYAEMTELGKKFDVCCITVRRIRDGIAWGGLV